MKKVTLLLCPLILFVTNVFAAQQCFIVKEKNKIILQEGDTKKRYSPCSTFKIPLSLIGYDAGILINETTPTWPFKEGYPHYLPAWKNPQDPSSWIKNSCVWYSQVLTKKLGMGTFQAYITKLAYGNMDLSGDKGKNNGLTNAWLSSSLEISPQEQIAFLEKLLANQLPVSTHAHEMTKHILFVEALPLGWKLYGKTGSGSLLSRDKMTKSEIQHGWFVGWIEKEGRVLVFSNHIIDDTKQDTYAGPRAKTDAKRHLLKVINQRDYLTQP